MHQMRHFLREFVHIGRRGRFEKPKRHMMVDNNHVNICHMEVQIYQRWILPMALQSGQISNPFAVQPAARCNEMAGHPKWESVAI